MCRSAFKNPRRTDGSPLFAEYCDAELVRDGTCGRVDAGEAGCDADAAGGAHNGVVNGAFFARGMITGRSGGAGSTELRVLEGVVAHESAEDDGPADGAGGVGGAAPAGSDGGATIVETGGNAGTGGGRLPTLGAACPCPCPCVLELAVGGVWERAVGAGEDHCVWTLRTGTGGSGAYAAGGVSDVVVTVGVDVGAGIIRGDVGTGAGVGMSNSVRAGSTSSRGLSFVSCESCGAPGGNRLSDG